MSKAKTPKITIGQIEEALEERERPDRRATSKAAVDKDRREKDRRGTKSK